MQIKPLAANTVGLPKDEAPSRPDAFGERYMVCIIALSSVHLNTSRIVSPLDASSCDVVCRFDTDETRDIDEKWDGEGEVPSKRWE